ncbi:helix-turn-helix domain-containing protein [Streptomyces sp. NPDC019507]|uniref:helix-turn-helix domain-containing protein n=1 Tax=Streptomyces sp. NPDC019507 TaxID=3154689 RepID=UPI0033CF3C84
MAGAVRVRRLTDLEGQRLQQIVRRGSANSVRYRRAMMLLASAGGNRVPVIAQLVQADEDTVRDVIHRFNASRLRTSGTMPSLPRTRCSTCTRTRISRRSCPGTRWRPSGSRSPWTRPA